MKLNTAILQFNPLLGDLASNISRIDQILDEVNDTQLIVLPELASTGYNFSSREEALQCAEALDDSSYIKFLSVKAEEKGAFIVSGINEKKGDILYNSSVMVGPEGFVAVYRKTHLFMNEKDIFEKGDGNMPVTDIGGVKVGMLICFDYLFPEIWRLQAMKGADVICHPSNLLTQNAHRCIPALSLMNRIFILNSNRIGHERGLRFNGQSFVTNPYGEVLDKASIAKEEIISSVLDIDQARDKWVTKRNHAFNDRRTDLY
jgi:predicted amidohydrolase